MLTSFVDSDDPKWILKWMFLVCFVADARFDWIENQQK